MCGYVDDGSWVVGSLGKRFCGFQERQSKLDCIPQSCDSTIICAPSCGGSLLCHFVWARNTSLSLISKFMKVSNTFLYVKMLVCVLYTVRVEVLQLELTGHAHVRGLT